MMTSQKLKFDKPQIMGILNLTPDSFYDGNRYLSYANYLYQVEKMLKEGADIIDIGAVSTRPGSEDISIDQELERLKKPIAAIRKEFPRAILSLDTFRTEIARIFWGEGIDIINDISGGIFDPDMLPFIDKNNIPYIMMHIQGTPQNMQQKPYYKDVVEDIKGFFSNQLLKLPNTHTVILDPGFGFGKRLEDNYRLLRNLQDFQELGHPVLVGLSRKSMVYKLLKTTPEEALNGTTVAHTIALLNKANILRVHDVKEAKESIALCSAVG